MQSPFDFNETLQRLQQQWKETDFCRKHGYQLYTSISFLLCFILIVKFFGFDRTPKCTDDICTFKMLIVLFSLAYSTIHLFALLFGYSVMQKLSKFSSQDAVPLAMASAGIAFFIVLIMAFVLIIYSSTTFDDHWFSATFYCFCWMLQPTFTILAVYMWKREIEDPMESNGRNQRNQTSNSIEKGHNYDNISTVFSVEPRSDSGNSEYTSLMVITPRLSSALIQQWKDRLCEVEVQNDPVEMRRTVREVIQHMNNMTNITNC